MRERSEKTISDPRSRPSHATKQAKEDGADIFNRRAGKPPLVSSTMPRIDRTEFSSTLAEVAAPGVRFNTGSEPDLGLADDLLVVEDNATGSKLRYEHV